MSGSLRALASAACIGSELEFTGAFERALHDALCRPARLEMIEERDLDTIGQEVAESGAICVAEGVAVDTNEGAIDRLFLPIHVTESRTRYYVADGRFGDIDIDFLHLLKWIYEARVRTMYLAERIFASDIFDIETGLLSKNALSQIIGQELERSKAFGNTIGFVLFKIQEAELIDAVRVIRPIVRRSDYLFRVSRSELMLMLVECTALSCKALVRRIRRAVEPPPVTAEHEILPGEPCELNSLLDTMRNALV